MNADERLMRKAIHLALLGRGRVEPNPVVGAVIVRGDRVVGYGHHARFGGSHAEAAALRMAGEEARGGTLYVTLEPCAHRGKTPPCTPAVIEAGVRKVVIGAADPCPLTSGRGPALLREAGIEVVEGFLADEARALNARYEAHLGADRPWTIAKWAMSLDGKIADREGGSRYITGPGARKIVHEIRGAVDAVVVGIGTVLRDDPDLRARDVETTRTAVRVVVDSSFRTPPGSRLVRSARDQAVWIAGVDGRLPGTTAELSDAGCRCLAIPAREGRVDLTVLFGRLKEEGVDRVLIEGGGRIHASAFAAGIVDQVMAFGAPILLGGRGAATPVDGEGFRLVADPLRLVDVRVTQPGADVLVEGFTAG